MKIIKLSMVKGFKNKLCDLINRKLLSLEKNRNILSDEDVNQMKCEFELALSTIIYEHCKEPEYMTNHLLSDVKTVVDIDRLFLSYDYIVNISFMSDNKEVQIFFEEE